MMFDCHQSILASYHYTQESIDQLERPCWLVFVEDASYENTSNNQEVVNQGYSMAYVGQVFNAGNYGEADPEYEKLARQVAESSIKYLFEHPQLQFSNRRGFFETKLRGLAGAQQLIIDGRSSVTLMSRDGVEGEAFWGFTIDVTVREQLVYNAVGY